ncbi:MAG: YceI family protein [Bacteroidota bacterium]|nr:YceI family protein [Bacteroidota bacterium]
MKKIKAILVIMLFVTAVQAQDKWFTKSGKILFDATVAKSPEQITGVNKSVTCVMDTRTGNLQFAVLMKGFEFERALMQEHFNENYVESDRFPKTVFKGMIQDNAAVNYTKDGIYPVQVKGTLNMHGQTHEVIAAGKISIQSGAVHLSSVFEAGLADYGIEIPQLVADKVARKARITVDCLLAPLK